MTNSAGLMYRRHHGTAVLYLMNSCSSVAHKQPTSPVVNICGPPLRQQVDRSGAVLLQSLSTADAREYVRSKISWAIGGAPSEYAHDEILDSI